MVWMSRPAYPAPMRPNGDDQVQEATGSPAPRAPWQAAVRGASALAVVLAVTACAQGEVHRIARQPHPTFSAANTVSRSERETEMNRQWQNKRLSELVEAYGRPRMVMNIPGGGMPPSFAVVYGPDPASGCIDAFAVSSIGDPVIRIYHCR
jgi:hypothetical protein